MPFRKPNRIIKSNNRNKGKLKKRVFFSFAVLSLSLTLVAFKNSELKRINSSEIDIVEVIEDQAFQDEVQANEGKSGASKGAGESNVASLELEIEEADAIAIIDVGSNEEDSIVNEKKFHLRKVKQNDSFYSILASEGIKGEEILNIIRSSKKFYNFKNLKPGDELKIVKVDGDLKSIEFLYSELEGIRILRTRDEKGHLDAEISTFEMPYYISPSLVRGEIEYSLYEDGLESGATPNVIMNFTDIFAWDVDFATELRKGDDFKILYEKYYVDDIQVKTGKILGASITNRGKTYNAYYYKDAKGYWDYYNEDGESISRTLLKSSLRYRRISSHFTVKRYHPVLKRYRSHHGIDFAAPRGTPVEASGDGVVEVAKWNGGYGKYIKIRHNSKYKTAYGHLKSFRRGIKKGSRVKQGQIIGYVGSTGLSTGPHLHYEVHVNGKAVNPLKVKSKSRKQLKGDDLDLFQASIVRIIAGLNINDEVEVASVPASGDEATDVVSE